MTDDASTTTPTGTTETRAKKATGKPLTPQAAAARKRPADRKPKQTSQQTSQQTAQEPQAARGRAGSSQSGREPLDMSVERDSVDIGFDFRPIPVRLGPGDEHLWHFNPDPGVDAWAGVQDAVAGFQSRKADEVSMGEAADLVEQVRHAVAEMLYNDDDKAAFLAEKRYGPMALVRLATRLMEEVTGFPTEP